MASAFDIPMAWDWSIDRRQVDEAKKDALMDRLVEESDGRCRDCGESFRMRYCRCIVSINRSHATRHSTSATRVRTLCLCERPATSDERMPDVHPQGVGP